MDVDKCLDVGVSALFNWIESRVPAPLRFLTYPIELIIRHRVKKELNKIFKKDRPASKRVKYKLANGLRPSLQDYREALDE